MGPASTTAILLFTRTAQEEAAVKAFVPHRTGRHNLRIARRLIRHSIKTARQTNLPLHIVYSSQQRGDSFGERLAGAVEDTLALGYERVLVIGNDCPRINRKLLRRAARQLGEQDWVLGPSKEGGLYLIGINRRCYQREAFISLHWQQADLYHDLCDQLAQKGQQLLSLPVFQDINDDKALQAVLPFLPMAILRMLLEPKTIRQFPSLHRPIRPGWETFSLQRALRAPPTFPVHLS